MDACSETKMETLIENNFGIASKVFSISGKETPSMFSKFILNNGEDPCQRIMLYTGHLQNSCYGVQTVLPNAHILCSTISPGEMAFSDEGWTKVEIYAGRIDTGSTTLLASVYSRLCFFHTILLHGAFVDWKGTGLVFTGPSGVGKTTQAKLWKRYTAADIVNGDKVFLRVFKGMVYACGSPWHGSSPYCLNQEAPVAAVVVLRQSTQNRIYRLTTNECTRLFMPHVFLPHWDKACLEAALETFDMILSQTPVYLLDCRPDCDSVQLVKQTVFGE